MSLQPPNHGLFFYVKNVFLHSDFKEEVYIRLPPGFPKVSKGVVAHLKCSLDRLKQPPKAWFEKLKDALLTLQFLQSSYDPSMFLHHCSIGITILLVYVDDFIITGTDPTMIQDLQLSLHHSFHMKDLIYFLGLEVHQSKKGMVLDQHQYTLNLIKMVSLTHHFIGILLAVSSI